MSDSITKAELLERAASASDTLCEDEFHDYFQNNCPGNTWYNLDDEASELWDKMPECVVQDSYLFRALVSAVAAEAYARGVAGAAAYLGVPLADLDNGVSEYLDRDREPLSGITIPAIDYTHDAG